MTRIALSIAHVVSRAVSPSRVLLLGSLVALGGCGGGGGAPKAVAAEDGPEGDTGAVMALVSPAGTGGVTATALPAASIPLGATVGPSEPADTARVPGAANPASADAASPGDTDASGAVTDDPDSGPDDPDSTIVPGTDTGPEVEPAAAPTDDSDADDVRPDAAPAEGVGGDARPEGARTAASGSCDIDDDLADRSVGGPDARFRDLLAALDVPSVSPVAADANDLVIERVDLVDPSILRVVVRKPDPNDRVHLIENVPSDPEVAWRHVMDELETATENGAGTIRFERDAVIRLSNPRPTGAHLAFEELSDVVVDFNGATLLLARNTIGIVVKDSNRVTFRNGTLKSEWLLSSVAITEADPDSVTGVRFAVLPQFVAPLEAQFEGTGNKPQLITVGNARETAEGWRIDARGSSDLFVNRGSESDRWTWKSSGTGAAKRGWFKAVSPASDPARVPAPGQAVYLLHQNNNGSGFVLKNDDGNVEDITLEDMTLLGIPGMGVFGEVNRGLHLDNVSIVPVPDDPLAIWGSSSDAVHLNNNGGDIVVENSTFGGSADDLFTAKGNWWEITSIDRDERSAVVENIDRGYGVHRWALEGDRLVVIDKSLEVIGQANHAKGSFKDKSKRHVIYLDDIPPTLEVGSLVANPDRSGGRIVLRDNTFANSRAQGALVQARHVVVEGNSFSNIAGPAVKLNFALRDWYESVSVGNVLISDNTFVDTGVGATKPPHPIYLSQEDAAGRPIDIIDNVRLVGNRPAGCP